MYLHFQVNSLNISITSSLKRFLVCPKYQYRKTQRKRWTAYVSCGCGG